MARNRSLKSTTFMAVSNLKKLIHYEKVIVGRKVGFEFSNILCIIKGKTTAEICYSKVIATACKLLSLSSHLINTNKFSLKIH